MDPATHGYLTPKRENLGGLATRHYPGHAFLHTPKEETGPTYILTSGDAEVSSPSLGLTTLYAESTPLYTPPLEIGSETTYWSHFHGSQGPETPLRGRGGPPERTLLVERLPHHSSFLVTPERQPLDFLSPERNRHTSGPDSGKRGRPRADIINNLMMEGAQSKNAIKCHICSRDFPREKSLQAHLRTHTGERPYNCDYPGCSKAFTQSGQLKTHQRLHAGEKPFVCSEEGCNNRYTHANRTCPDHPYAKPKRTAELVLQPVIVASEDQTKVAAWLEKYRREREEKTPGKMTEERMELTPKREEEEQGRPKLKSKRGLASELEQAFGQENLINFGQENIPSPPRPQIQRSDLVRNKLTGALHRTAQKMERSNMRVVHLQAGQPHDQPGFTPGFKNILEIPYTHASPVKSMRRCLEEASPLRGVRRTLGEITPSKNCQDQTDLELPFTFDLVGQGLGVDRLPAMPSTPRPREETSPSQLGSPMLKLKKRFQERFQEEKERGEELARPIAWTEEEDNVVLQEHLQDSLLTTPVRRREATSSPTFLVAGALLELHDSPVRKVDSNNHQRNLQLSRKSSQEFKLEPNQQDVPLNLTTRPDQE